MPKTRLADYVNNIGIKGPAGSYQSRPKSNLDKGIVSCQSLELVGSRDEREPGQFGNFRGNFFGETFPGVEAGSDGSSSSCEHVHPGKGCLDTLDS